MSHKEGSIGEESRITLTLSGLWVLISGVVVCVTTVLGTYFKITSQLSDIQTVINSGVVTYDDHEKWVLKAKAANAVSYPNLVWPSIKDKDYQVVNSTENKTAAMAAAQ